MSHQNGHRKGRRLRPRTIVLLTILALLAPFVIAGLSLLGYIAIIVGTGPGIEDLKPLDKGSTSLVLAADGSRLGYVQAQVVRTPIAPKDMPQTLRQATVAIEDKRFFDHRGIDYQGIVRAGVENLRSGRALQGGSTITQQLVRALYIKNPQRTYTRKLREATLAADLERRRSKDWILNEYLNTIPYGTVEGRTRIGAEAAAQTFFSKPARELSLEEAALLAGLPQAPSRFNPIREPRRALQRRNAVIRRMLEERMISPGRARKAYSAPLRVRRSNRYTVRREPYFFDYVQEQLIEEYGVGVYRNGGLKIHTTIDPKLQETGRRAIQNHLGYPDDPSAAVVAVDPATGYIRAMASSGTYDERTFNLAAQGHRQPGSAFKTFVLTTAVRRGIDPSRTMYTSKPLNLNPPGFGPWKVSTYGDSYGGRMNLVDATLVSDNTVYAQLDLDLGPREVAETARDMGIETQLDGIPSEGLGGLRLGVSPLEMANAYATLASGGMRSKPKAIREVEFPDGKTEDLGKPDRTQVFSDGVAAEVTRILELNIKRGTGKRASIGCPAAGKTGTTDDFNDAWFAGYTPSLAAAVWVGYPDALREMRSVHGVSVAGGTFPAEIWGTFMRSAKSGNCRPFPPPQNPVSLSPFTGGGHGGTAPSVPAGGPSRSSRASRGYGAGSAGSGAGAYSQGYGPPNRQGGSYYGGYGGAGGYGGYDPGDYQAPPDPGPSGGSGAGDGSSGGADGGTGDGGTGASPTPSP